jgi:hypothetical protein
MVRRRPLAGGPDFYITRHVVDCAPNPCQSKPHKRRCKRTPPTSPFHRWTHDHPLWRFELVEGHEGGSALTSVMKSLVDGGHLPPKQKHCATRGGIDSAESWSPTP